MIVGNEWPKRQSTNLKYYGHIEYNVYRIEQIQKQKFGNYYYY